MTAANDPQTETKPRRGLFRRVIDVVMAAIIVLLLAWAALFFVFAPDLPDTDALWAEKPNPGLSIIGADGRKIIHRRSFNGLTVRLSQLPDRLPQAVLATEDRRFYEHFGMDILGFLRAALTNLQAGRVVQGGSTITQQLAKNLYLSHERTVLRKIRELILAVWLETRLSKDQILELYLNRVYLGAGAYDMEAAAQRYFGKSARAVTLAEAAMLAGLLKAPSTYAPTTDLSRARGRAAQVLQNMVAAGYITTAQAQAARQAPAALARQQGTRGANYFVDWITETLQRQVSFADKDLVVYTTLDPTLQEVAEAVIQDHLGRRGAELNVGQAALVALSLDGAVRAMAGGRSYAASQFNRAVEARRQPGSAFKPFVFLAGLETGITPETVVDDKPVRIGDWQPRNYTGTYLGRISLRRALAQSVNSVAVQIQERVGRGNVIKSARRMGITSDLKPEPSLALGTFEVTPLELSAAFLPFANGGRAAKPYGITAIHDPRGRDLYGRPRARGERAIPARQAEMMSDMLAAVIRAGTGRAARPNAGWAAGKTGTTQDSRDGWFIGYSADLVIGVWVGNDDASATRGVTGGRLPAEIWKDVMDRAQRATLAQRPAPLPRRRPDAPIDDGLAEAVVDWFFESVFNEEEVDKVVDSERVKEAARDVLDWVWQEIEESGDAEPKPDADRGR